MSGSFLSLEDQLPILFNINTVSNKSISVYKYTHFQLSWPRRMLVLVLDVEGAALIIIMIFSLVTRELMSYLHIAEKNSIAKEVSQILSGGNKRTGTTLSKYNPVFHFEIDGHHHTFSSVRGHIFSHQLPPQCKSWYSFDNKKILTREVPMMRKPGEGMQDLLRNLQSLARGKRQLVLWLDCDRQGEAIAFEVLEVIQRINPHIKISRARFAAVTMQDITRAFENLTIPNKLQADAVTYRTEIDFRMGCAFTRYQTTTFQKRYQLKEHSVISYGPCQMPTLGFVVERYLQIKNFKPEKYWVIEAAIVLDQRTSVPLKCQRGNFKDQVEVNTIFANMFQRANVGAGQVRGKVLQRNKNQKKKYRPYPLTTVKFQKLATDKLRISSAQAMSIAEKLYMSGFISYPRTETNAFPATMHVPQLVKRLQNCTDYSNYVAKLMQQGKFMKPKMGNQNDQAHAPIHPVKPADHASMQPNQWRVYDLITRHFLACCSKDAIGIESQIVAEIGGEYFRASHLMIKEKNYLQIYPFQKWTESEFPGEIPQDFEAALELRQSKTQPPGYLTESDLITQMEKNQIGTDSTIHEHIETIQTRKYAVKTSNTFKPTNLGASLIVTYKQLGLKLEDCHIRRIMEQRMNSIAEGSLSLEQATKETLFEVTPIFDSLQRMQDRWLEEIGQAMSDNQNLTQIQMSTGQDRTNQRNQSNEDNQHDTASNITSIVCYGCKKPGHLFNNCPERQNQRKEPARFNQPSPPAERKGIVCYHCKEPGHGANDCKNKNMKKYEVEKTQGRKFTCFSCGEEGHFAPDCPKRQRSNNDGENTSYSKPVCYNCKKEGHFANKCPNDREKSKEQDVKERKKICAICGVEGRHPKGSSCPGKKKGKKTTFSQQEEDD